MSSAGQIVGGIVGAVAGFFVGGPAGVVQGAALGAGIGGYIDPPPGPNLKGPTLDDKTFQSSAYGVGLADLDGTIATMGNIIYLENNEYKAVSKKESQGGKGGGGGGTYETTTYYATFAVALSREVPGGTIRRLWAGGKLIFSAGSGDIETFIQSSNNARSWKFYDGTQTEPDSRMESVLGLGKCPSYEGTAYIIFYDFDLTEYGNGLAGCPIKAEVIASGIDPSDGTGSQVIGYIDATPFVPNNSVLSCSALVRADDKFFSCVGWGYSGEKYGDAVIIDMFNGAGVDQRVSPTSPENGVHILPGSSNVNNFWFQYRIDAPGSTVGDLAVTDGSKVLTFDGWSISRVHEDYLTGVVFSISKNVEGEGLQRRLVTEDNTAFIPLTGTVNVSIGDGVVALIKSGVVEIYSPSLTLLRSVPYSGSDYASAVASTIFNGHIYVATNPFSLSGATFSMTRISLSTGESHNVSFDTGEIFNVHVGAESKSTLTCIEGIFGYGSKISKGTTSSFTYGFIYFGLGGSGGGFRENRKFAYLNSVVSKYLVRSGLGIDDFDVGDLSSTLVEGYRTDGIVSARAAVAPLQTAFLFDLVEHGYALRAIRRGGESIATIPFSSFGARDFGSDIGVIFHGESDSISQLPGRYSIAYLDYDREYDSSVQYADYPVNNQNERSEQLALVMSADAAAKLADVLVNLAHVESKKFKCSLPQEYLSLKTSDVITAEVSPGIFEELRIENCNYSASQVVSIDVRRAVQSSYQSGAVGSAVDPPSELIPLISRSHYLLLDIPLILNAYDQAGFVAAMYGAGSWPGGVLFRSSDGGQSFSAIQSMYGPATVAIANDKLTENSGAVIDRVSVLNVAIESGEFQSVTEAQMMTGKNYCAYGVDGRWEIMQFSGAVLEADKSITLSNFVRGMRGTEWATGIHQAGDYVVLLDDPDNAFIGSDLSEVGLSRQFKAVTVGQSVQDVTAEPFTYRAVNLLPLSPINCVGDQVGNDWIITWTPRTRYGGSYWYTGVQPKNETVLAFDVLIKNGADIVRVVQVAAAHFIYTEAQQIEDFGSPQSSLTIAIYQVSQAVGRGYPLEVIL